MNIEWVKTKDIIPNAENPRIIKDDKFKKLVKSIKDFPEMLEIRPIVVNNEMTILGGNMRLKAIQEIGIKEIPIIKAENLTEEQQREFLIRDNTNYGSWDWDALANDFDADDLEDWGLELPKVIDEVEDEPKIDTQKITLEYTPDEYNQVKKALQKIASTPEQAVWKLLEL